MLRRPLIPLWCLVLAFAGAVRSASAASYPISHFDQLRGLVVSSLYQDSKGYIWLATETGLWRGHANGFEPITAPTTLGKPSLVPDTWGRQGKCLLEDDAGTLWIGTDFGLIALCAESLGPRPVPDVLASGNIFCLARDPSGGLWVGTNEGLYHVEVRNGTAIAERLKGTESRRIYSVAAGDSDDLWLGSIDALLHVKGEQVETHMEDRIGGGPVSLLRATDGALWIGLRDDGGLYRIAAGQTQRMTKAHGLLNDDVNVIIQAPNGDVWVGTEDGAFRWTGETFEAVNRATGLENTDVHSILADSEGQIWIGTFGSGAFQIRSPDILTYGVDDGLEHSMVTALAHAPGGRVLVGTMRGAGYFDPKAPSTELIEPRDNISAVHVDARKQVWISSQHHIWKEGETKRVRVPGRVFALADNPDGGLFVGVSGRLYALQGETIERVPLPDEIRPPIFAILTAASGDVYLGTASGLARRKDQVWSLAAGGMVVRSLCEVPDGTLWLGTERSLVPWREDEAGQPQRALLPTCGRVNDLAADADGLLWAATSDGLLRLRDGRLDHFTLADGLPSNDVRAILIESRGILFAGTTQGLARIDTSRLPNQRLPLPVTIQFWSSERMLGGSQDGIQKIPFSEQDILVRVSHIGWRSSVGTRYQYKLDGRDATWSNVTSQNSQRFTDLPPGHYTFRARAVNDHGSVSDAPAEFSFTILAPFWRRPSFLAGAGGMLLAMSFLAAGLRSRRIELAAERRRREAAVRENEKKFHALADSISAAAFIFRDSRLLYVNPAAEAMVEYTRDELQGMEFWKVLHPDFRELARQRGLARQNGETVLNRYEVKILTKTGKSRWVDFTAGVIEFEGTPAVLGTAFDITDRKLKEAEIKANQHQLGQRAREARLLYEVTEFVAQTTSFDDALQKCVDSVCEAVGWPLGHAYVLADDGSGILKPTQIWFSADGDPFERFRGITTQTEFSPGVGLPGRVLASSEPAWIIDVQKDSNFPRATKACADIGVHGAFAFPIELHGNIVAVLEFFDAEPVPPDENLLRTMRMLGKQLGRVLERASTVAEIRRSEAQLSEALRELETQKSAIDQHLIVAITDTEGRITYANDRFCQISQYAREELIGQNHRIINSGHHPKSFFKDLWDTITRGETWRGEVRNLAKDGSDYWVDTTIVPFKDETGHITQYVALRTDISERKSVEDALRLTQFAIDRASDAAFWVRPDGRFIYVNDAACRLYGRTREEFFAEGVFGINPALSREELAASWQANKESGYLIFEARHLKKNGEWFPVEITSSYIQFEGNEYTCVFARDITQRRAHEEALRESEEWFRTLVEHAPEAILLLDVDTGKLVDANENALKLTGMSKKELLRVGPADISPALQPDGRPSSGAAAEKIEQALRGESPVFEWMHQRSDGTSVPCEVRLVRLPSAKRRLVRASITDITERIKSEKTVRELATFADENPSPVLRVAADGRILYANPASKSFLEARGCRVGQELPEPWRQEVSKILESQTRKEEEIDCAGKTISMMFTPVPDAGYVNLYGRDITQRKRTEEQLRQSQKMEAVGTLASGVAHEFDNLLTAISTYTELAKSTIPEGHQAVRALEKVEEVAKQARGVTVALLTFSHRAAIPKTAVNLSRQVSETARLLGRLLPAKIEIVENISSSEDLWIKADPGQLQQVLMNLALNSRDAMPDGGQLSISLEDGKPLSDLSTGDRAHRGSNGSAVITVKDTGCGMSAEVLARMFEPFYTTKPRGQGTGLGMSLVHGIVKDLGGEIAVRSQPEQGAHISITLPCIAGPEDPLSEESPHRSGADHGKIVLVVEKNDYIRSIITSTLRSRGFEVLPASDIEQAISALHKREHLIGLIILDLDMSDEAGLVRLQALHENREDLPFVILAGTLSINLRAHGLDRSHLLRKPFQMVQLTTVVDQLLSQIDDKGS